MIGVPVALRRPAVGQTGREHRGMRAGTVLMQAVAIAATAQQLVCRIRVERQIRRVVERGVVETTRGEDATYDGDVSRLTGVRRTCERHRLLVRRLPAATQ